MPTSEIILLAVWGVILLTSIIAEVSTQALVSYWFAVGAFSAFIVSLFPNVPYWVSIVVFFSVSLLVFLVSLVFFRDRMRFAGKKDRTNIDSAIGETLVLQEGIPENGTGKVLFQSIPFEAESEDGIPLEKGTKVVVLEVEGNHFIVRKAKEKKED